MTETFHPVSIRVLQNRDRFVYPRVEVTGDASGVITYNPATADVATAGAVKLEVEVTWPDGTVQTFPTGGQARLDVVPDIQP